MNVLKCLFHPQSLIIGNNLVNSKTFCIFVETLKHKPMKNPFANLVKGFFGKKEQPKAKVHVTPSLNAIDKVKNAFTPEKGSPPLFYCESQKLAAIRKKRKMRNRMQKHSRCVNFKLA